MKKTLIVFGFFLFIIGIYYLITYKKRKKRSEIRKKVLVDSERDYGKIAKNMAFSISKSKNLYKLLIAKVHPDRFQDEKKVIAEHLSRKINNAKKNYDELISLKVEVDEFLKHH